MDCGEGGTARGGVLTGAGTGEGRRQADAQAGRKVRIATAKRGRGGGKGTINGKAMRAPRGDGEVRKRQQWQEGGNEEAEQEVDGEHPGRPREREAVQKTVVTEATKGQGGQRERVHKKMAQNGGREGVEQARMGTVCPEEERASEQGRVIRLGRTNAVWAPAQFHGVLSTGGAARACSGKLRKKKSGLSAFYYLSPTAFSPPPDIASAVDEPCARSNKHPRPTTHEKMPPMARKR